MTITDFSLLTITDQLSLLHTEGVFLAKRRIGSEKVILYQFQKVYVEIYYKKYRQVVSCIRFSENIDFLEPYLDTIALPDFFKSDS